MSKTTLPAAADIAALAKTDPAAAWKAVAPFFSLPVPKPNVARVCEWISALEPHGTTLPEGWRQALIAFLSNETPFQTEALFAMARAPHVDFVPALIAYHEHSVQRLRDIFAENGEVFGQAWDDRQVLSVLSVLGDARAVPLLEALLVQADKVSHWHLLLDACARAEAPALIPALRRWREKSAKKNPTWEGLAHADRVITALEAVARKKGLPIPERPSLEPLVAPPPPGKKKAPTKTKKAPVKKKAPPKKR